LLLPESDTLFADKELLVIILQLYRFKTIARRTAHPVNNFIPPGSMTIGWLRSIGLSRVLALFDETHPACVASMANGCDGLFRVLARDDGPSASCRFIGANLRVCASSQAKDARGCRSRGHRKCMAVALMEV
jgi:hypothetical protein